MENQRLVKRMNTMVKMKKNSENEDEPILFDAKIKDYLWIERLDNYRDFVLSTNYVPFNTQDEKDEYIQNYDSASLSDREDMAVQLFDIERSDSFDTGEYDFAKFNESMIIVSSKDVVEGKYFVINESRLTEELFITLCNHALHEIGEVKHSSGYKPKYQIIKKM